MKYTGTITVHDYQGNCVFERVLGTDEIIDALVERISFFQKPPESGDGVVVGPHNINRIVDQMIGDRVLKNGRMGTLFGITTAAVPKTAERINGKWTCCGRKGYKHDTNCEYASLPKRKEATEAQVASGFGYGRRKQPVAKPCCGSLSNRHKKDCDGELGGDRPKKNPDMAELEEFDYVISESDFSDIKDLQHDEKTSVQAASDLGLDTIAVIRAFACKSWSDYRLATRNGRNY